MNDPLFDELTPEGIVELCGGLTQPAAQLRRLHALGLIQAFRSRRGKVRVFRISYQAWRAPKPPEPTIPPEFLVPPRPAWKDTGLGRWQQEQRRLDAEWRAANPPPPEPSRAEKFQIEAAAAKEAREARAALVRHHTAKRRCTKLQRTPAWADMHAIKAVYAEARRISRETGIPHHVDHEIPLQGRLVSGLHVHNNLQIITGSENSKKRNRFEVQG